MGTGQHIQLEGDHLQITIFYSESLESNFQYAFVLLPLAIKCLSDFGWPKPHIT